MEKEGINIDSTYLNKLEQEFEKDLNKLKKDIFNQSGEEFNLNSPKQLGDILLIGNTNLSHVALVSEDFNEFLKVFRL